MNPKKWQKILAWSFIVFMLLLLYAPILILIFYSFTESAAGEWGGFSLQAYGDLFNDPKLMEAVLNTFILAVSSALIATVLGTFAAIGLFNMKSKAARTAISGANQITVVNADIVTGVSFMLLFVALKNIGLDIPRGWFTLITSHVVITTPYVIMTVLPRLRQLNPNTYEAALDLGATPFKATMKVLLPQLIGAMIAGFALAFTLSLDDFVIAKYNRDPFIDTISTYIYASVIKQGISNSFRALSTLLFVLIMGILVFMNVRSRKGRKPHIGTK